MFELNNNKEDVERIKASGVIKLIPGVGTKLGMGMINRLPKGHSVVCGYDQGLGERLFVCDSEQDIKDLYDNYYRGGALNIFWYSGVVVTLIAK